MSNGLVSPNWCGLLAHVDVIIKSAAQERHRSATSLANKSLQVSGQDLELSQEHKIKMVQLLEAYQSNLVDFEQHVRFSSSGYTKNLVTDIKLDDEPTVNNDNRFFLANVIIMCWAPKQASAFHAHEGSRCFVKVLQGQLTEQRLSHPKFKTCRPEPMLTTASRSVMSLNDVCYIDDEIGCHQVSNESSNEPAVTLHIYAPPYKKCRIFRVPQTSGVDLLTESSSGCFNLTMANSETVDVFQ